jgi:mannose-6-phosphate isomerase-like protein (cupin superfamily)
MNDETRNIYDVLDGMSAHWSPTTIATVNDYDVRVVRVLGEFTRHSHPETDEFFLVLSGSLAIRMAEGEVTLVPGDTYVVERGRPHQPYAENVGLTRFAGQPDYAAAAASSWWMVVASYSTGVR